MKDVTALREELFDAISLLKQGKIDSGQANAISNLAGRVIDSAKVEADYVQKFGGRSAIPSSGFIGRQHKPDTLDQQAMTHGSASTPQRGAGLPPPGPKGRL